LRLRHLRWSLAGVLEAIGETRLETITAEETR
jgi:hypothetical protein